MNSPPTFIVKYKPYFINDFCIDTKTKAFLRTLLDIDDLNILCVGNSNSGKTSLLYALIREYYGLGKNASLPENNILFINNLKEQGINYFRNEMKTFSQSRTTIYGKKKMIIVDDIDMINQQSQQVFCNYMDKYRNNIVFVSVCSNIQKVIESIQSRIHIIKIQSPNAAELLEIMNRIIEQEKMIIDESSKEYLLLVSNHSVRNLITNLEKIYILGEPVTLELCKNICSNIYFQHFEQYIKWIRSKNLSEAIGILYSIYDYGYSVIDILDYFFTFIKLTPLLEEEEKYRVIPFLCKYISVFHNIHEDSIELALFTNSLYQLFVPSEVPIP
jgi:DNA polymerase III delta prime subunit